MSTPDYNERLLTHKHKHRLSDIVTSWAVHCSKNVCLIDLPLENLLFKDTTSVRRPIAPYITTNPLRNSFVTDGQPNGWTEWQCHFLSCSSQLKMPWYGLKVEINDFNQSICSPEKVCLYEVEFFGSLLSQIHRYTYSKCILIIQDVLKIGKYHEMG